MLSLNELHRAAGILGKELGGKTLQRIVQVNDFKLVLVFYGTGGNSTILISCRPEFARISCVDKPPKAPPVPPSFCQFMRAHLSRASFSGIDTAQEDRQVSLGLRSREGNFRLILSILGARSNIYLIDADGLLSQSMRPLEETRRDLAFGKPWDKAAGKAPNKGGDRWIDVPDEEYLQAIERFYAQAEQRKEFDRIARRIDQALTREESYLQRKAANLLEDLGKSQKAQEWRRKGEILKTVLHELPAGAEEVSAKDFESGERVRIPLDPQKTPAENMAACFKKYHKDMRAESVLKEQIETVTASRKELSMLRVELQALQSHENPDLEALNRLEHHSRIRKLLTRFFPAARFVREKKKITIGKREVPSRLLPRRYKTDQGFEIWVGRNDEGNDYLTTKLARGNDLFFHLEGFPGSHVVLRTEGRTDPPSESVLDACELAVHFSKLRGRNRADVHVVPIKNVKKPKGAKPGLVQVRKGKTIHLRCDQKRLENILASRIED